MMKKAGMKPVNQILLKPAAALLAALAILVAATPVRADLAWEAHSIVTVKAGDARKTLIDSRQSYNLKDNVLRIDDLGTGSARFYNFTNQSVLEVSFSQKIFASAAMRDLINATREQRMQTQKDLGRADEILAGMQGEERELFAAQIEGQKTKYELWMKPYKVVPTQEYAEILGHKCQKFNGLAGDTVFQEIWATQDIELDNIYKTRFAPGMANLDRQEYSAFLMPPGFPVKVTSQYGPVTAVVEVTHLTEALIPSQAFILPEGLMLSPAVGRTE